MMQTPLRMLLALSMACLMVACASGPSHPSGSFAVAQADGSALPAPDSTNEAGAYEGASDYRIGAQDLLEISVFGVDELNQTVRVNSNGQISLPLVGSVMAGGRTIPELEKDLAGKYSQGFLQNPQITVFVKEFTSQRVTLEGALNKPGIYPITGKTSLLQAIAMGQGLDEFADLNGVVVFRQVDGKKMAAAFNMRDIRSGKSPDPQIYGDDIIVVERSGSKSALREFLRTVPALGLFMAL